MKKVAIFLPERYDLACLRKARKLALAAAEGRNLQSTPVRIVFGLPQVDKAKWRRDEAYLRAGLQGAVVRHLVWERVQADNTRRMYPWNQRHEVTGLSLVTVARDWGSNFVDCDYWFNLAGPSNGAFLTHRPTAHFWADLSMRQQPRGLPQSIPGDWPLTLSESFRLFRSDELHVAPDEPTFRDLTSFAGIHPDKRMLLPELEPTPNYAEWPDRQRVNRRVIWRVEPGRGDVIADELEGLRLFLDEGGDLDVRVVCESTKLTFGHVARYEAGMGGDQQFEDFLEDLNFERVCSDADIARQMAQAEGVWVSRRCGGEAAAALEGLCAGLPVLAARSAPHVALQRKVGERLTLYDPDNSQKTADALHAFAGICTAVSGKAQPMRVSADFDILACRVGFVIDRLQEHVNV